MQRFGHGDLSKQGKDAHTDGHGPLAGVHGLPNSGTPGPHDRCGNHVEIRDNAHWTVRVPALDGGQVCHCSGQRAAKSHAQVEPGNPWVKPLDHEDSAKCSGEIQPTVGFDALTIKENGQQHCEDGGGVLDDRRTGERYVSNGVKEEGESNHPHDAPNHQPFAIVTEEGLSLLPEPQDAEEEADRTTQKDQLRCRQKCQGLHQQVGRSVQHHRLEHED